MVIAETRCSVDSILSCDSLAGHSLAVVVPAREDCVCSSRDTSVKVSGVVDSEDCVRVKLLSSLTGVAGSRVACDSSLSIELVSRRWRGEEIVSFLF